MNRWVGDARFDESQMHRYLLTREQVGRVRSIVCFAGLNPSVAGAVKGDPTVTRLMAFTLRWGYSSLSVVNTNPHIATDPSKSIVPGEIVLSENDRTIREQFEQATLIVCMWGTNVEPALADRVVGLLPRDTLVGCFGRNKNGTPKHPLYLRDDCALEPYP